MIDDTLVHIMLLTRHIRRGDMAAALLALLVELSFSPSNDGFHYLRKALILKCQHPEMRFNELYREVGRQYDPELTGDLIERAIRGAIDAAWKNRIDREWAYFFPNRRTGAAKKPSNGEFIANIACGIELWCSSREESFNAK